MTWMFRDERDRTLPVQATVLIMKNLKLIQSGFKRQRHLGHSLAPLICLALLLVCQAQAVGPEVALQSTDSSSEWDQPFDKPMYLLHTKGGKYYNSNGEEFGTIIDARWILDPNNNGFIDIPNPKTEGAITRYRIDQTMGPYYTPREVCAVAAEKYPCIVQGSEFIIFNCKDMPAQPEKPNESGAATMNLLVQTASGTTEGTI